MTVLAAVRVAPGTTELREFPAPTVAADSALLAVEVAGICGTDVKMYAKPPFPDPVIMGHENVGVIVKAGRTFAERQGVGEGDRVFVGQYRHCEATDWRTNPSARRTSRDATRLELAKALGADHVIDVQVEDPRERIHQITGGRGVDVVLDCPACARHWPPRGSATSIVLTNDH
jgi:threonine dehydrogenase-like Zn-dependent dehydrogenase